MGKYELLYIVHPDLESSIDKITGRVKSQITEKGGKITYEENWGKRKLAYPIKKAETGIYVLVYFELPKESFAKLERDLRLTEEIIRFMALSKEEKIAKAKAPKAEREKKEAPKAEIKEEKTVEKPKKKMKRASKSKPSAGEAQSRTFIKSAGEKPAEETEEERMKKLDEKLGAILGKEEEK